MILKRIIKFKKKSPPLFSKLLKFEITVLNKIKLLILKVIRQETKKNNDIL